MSGKHRSDLGPRWTLACCPFGELYRDPGIAYLLFLARILLSFQQPTFQRFTHQHHKARSYCFVSRETLTCRLLKWWLDRPSIIEGVSPRGPHRDKRQGHSCVGALLQGFQGYGFSPFYGSFWYDLISLWFDNICVFVSSTWGPLTVYVKPYPWNPLLLCFVDAATRIYHIMMMLMIVIVYYYYYQYYYYDYVYTCVYMHVCIHIYIYIYTHVYT